MVQEKVPNPKSPSSFHQNWSAEAMTRISKKRKTTSKSFQAKAAMDTQVESHEEVSQSRPLEVEDADRGSPNEQIALEPPVERTQTSL